MMTQEEMRMSVCKRLPGLIDCSIPTQPCWLTELFGVKWSGKPIYWPTEGLQICHEAEKTLNDRTEWGVYINYLTRSTNHDYRRACASATYEQKLQALCRVWFPERF